MLALYAGVDLGGTTITALLATDAGETVAEEGIATDSHDGPDRVLARIAALVSRLARGAGGAVSAVGLGVPGLVDPRRGRSLFFPNLPGNWRDVDVAGPLHSALHAPVFLLNDARMATLGELTFGAGRGADTMVFLTLGTGIGGGVVVDGRLRLGPLGAAGEVGHQTVAPGGPRCGCGNEGCLEAVASAPALVGEGVRLMRSGQAPRLLERVQGDPAAVTPREMAWAADAGEEPVAEAITRVGRYLGVGVSNLVTTLHPDLVVLGGGMSNLGERVLAPVRDELRRRVRMFPVDNVRVERSQLGERAGVLGGIALARQGGILEKPWTTPTTTSPR